MEQNAQSLQTFFGSLTIFNKDKSPDAVLSVPYSLSMGYHQSKTDIFFHIVYIQVKWIFEKAMQGGDFFFNTTIVDWMEADLNAILQSVGLYWGARKVIAVSKEESVFCSLKLVVLP